MSSMQEQLRKQHPFDNPVHEAVLSIVHTADVLSRPVEALLSTFDLSAAQYNVLRILRGVREAGLPCGQICQRMVTRDPDMTRLLDRLERRQLITRSRGEMDRRVVQARITPDGQALIARIDQPLDEIHQRQLSQMTPEQIAKLIELLAAARGGLPTESPQQEGSL